MSWTAARDGGKNETGTELCCTQDGDSRSNFLPYKSRLRDGTQQALLPLVGNRAAPSAVAVPGEYWQPVLHFRDSLQAAMKEKEPPNPPTPRAGYPRTSVS